jgi:hypothetical protein
MENNFIRINLAESKLPIFKENKSKGFVTFGEDNLYPMGIIELFNKSPKHSAIVTQKASYIAGDKTEIIGQSTEDIAKANDYLSSINAYEDFESLKQKIAQDLELFDGFALEIIWNKAKTSIAEIYHLPFQNVRIGLEGDYVYCDDWSNRRAEHYRYPCWNPTTRENKQVYYFKMYRAGQEMYPLPSYVGALKYIEIDTEIANFHLNSIKSGFSAQTLVQLFKGIPNATEARNTIKRFKDNFTGTDNAGSVIIQFNDPNETPSRVDNLAPSDFDKLFMQLNDTVQQEIFSGHRVTSPMLFGIRVEGQLGGRSELIESYEAFQKAYVEPRQSQLDAALNSIFKYIVPVRLTTTNRPPLGQDYSELYTKGLMSLDEARNELGFAKQKDQKTVVDSINNLSPLVANKVIEQMTVNEIRNIAGLKPILGGDQPSKPTAMSSENPFGWDDDRDVKVFEQFGEHKENFEEVKFEFASTLGIAILQWLNANTGMQLADLINGIKADPQVITEEVAKLISDGLLNDDLTTTEQGSKELQDSGVTTEIVVRYEYTKAPGISGSEVIPTSRDFCRRLVGFNRLYTREDIEQMTSILGYDVWRRRGGWMTVKGSSPAVHVPYCRHYWASRLVRRKL